MSGRPESLKFSSCDDVAAIERLRRASSLRTRSSARAPARRCRPRPRPRPILPDHSQHRRASSMALARRDVAQRAQHLRHVHDFGQTPRDVVQRQAVVVRLAVRLEHQPGADAPHRAADEPRRRVGVRRPRARSACVAVSPSASVAMRSTSDRPRRDPAASPGARPSGSARRATRPTARSRRRRADRGSAAARRCSQRVERAVERRRRCHLAVGKRSRCVAPALKALSPPFRRARTGSPRRSASGDRRRCHRWLPADRRHDTATAMRTGEQREHRERSRAGRYSTPATPRSSTGGSSSGRRVKLTAIRGTSDMRGSTAHSSSRRGRDQITVADDRVRFVSVARSSASDAPTAAVQSAPSPRK